MANILDWLNKEAMDKTQFLDWLEKECLIASLDSTEKNRVVQRWIKHKTKGKQA